ncbi:MAG: hypothetical protein WC898_01780 [Candidatus Paceibacterota bacterium]
MNSKRKNKYSEIFKNRALYLIDFIESEYFSNIKYQHNGQLIDDMAYIFIIQLLQVFALELILKSSFIKISKFNNYKDLCDKLQKINHKLDSNHLKDVFSNLKISILKKKTLKQEYFIILDKKEKYIFYEFTWIRYLIPLRKNLGKSGLVKNRNTYTVIDRNLNFMKKLTNNI